MQFNGMLQVADLHTVAGPANEDLDQVAATLQSMESICRTIPIGSRSSASSRVSLTRA